MKNFLLVLLVLGIILAAVLWFRRGAGPDRPPVAPANGDGSATAGGLSPDEARRLIELKNVAIGYLENDRPAEAIARLDEISAQAPEEPLGPQNVSIARLLAMEKAAGANDRSRFDEEATAAAAALDRLSSLTPGAPALHFLRGKLFEQTQRTEEAFDEFLSAAEAAETSPALWFAVHEQGKALPEGDRRRRAEDALGRAYELAPDNIFLWWNWIVVQAQRQDGALAGTLEGMRKTLEFLAPDLRRLYPQYDILQLLDSAIVPARNGEWARALGACRALGNIIKGHDASRSDLDFSIKRHILDFVVFDFSPEFHAAHAPAAAADDAIAVSFQPLAGAPPLAEGRTVLDAALADVDLDGRLDVCVLHDGALEVHRQADDGWKVLARADVPAGLTRLAVQDLDDDADKGPPRSEPTVEAGRVPPEARGDAAAAPGAAAVNEGGRVADHSACNQADVDFVLWGQAGVRLLKNEWDREADRRELVVIEPDPPLPEAGAVHALEVADLDMDGDLDLLLSTDSGVKLWSSRSNWSFDDITSNSLLPPADLRVTGAFGFDLDRDIDVDVLLCTSEGPIGYLENLRHKTFRWRALDVPRVASAAAIEPLDLDGNASWDFVTGGAEVQLVLTRTPERGRLVIERAASVSGAPVGGLTTWDYDNDGRTDVLAWNSDRPSFFRGTADGELDYAGNLLDGVAVPAPLLRCDVGDLDGDGDLDLLLAGGSGIVLCSNEGGDSHHSLGITVAAQFSLGKENQQTRRSNHYGTGSLLELKAGERFQQQVIRRQRTHFGLGRAEHADVARLTWTNGCPQNIMEPEQGRTYCEIGTAKGSCPFVYAWDGQQFAFVTDLCWGAPLGLQNAEGGLVPCRDWEYILIPGECLAPREGRYVLQTTEELWEAAYFDQVRLMAVDHPAEIEVYSNEKVGPPDISQFLIHTVHKRRYPVSVVNHRGRDLLRELSARDGVFARPFDRALMQGYTEDTYIEIDLGDVSPRAELARTFSGDATAEAEVGGRKITLFLTGWLLPTDTTINVALVENPDLPAPKPPAILVPDTDGEWREVRPFMGFPGGKTKTIAVNLTGIFPTDDRRLRIATSMQLYWDEIFFTVDEEPGRIEVRDLALVSADLHYRGFSRRIPRPHHAPAWFEYAAVRSEPAWPPMGGSFTRYGDVTALVRDADDVQVVMTSGDEMTLEFAVPEAPLPDGWTRDFIMYSIGWDKDADLHTLLGQVSEPLPFRGHTSYPYPPEQFPDSRVHRDWLRDYQTRTIDDLAFRRLIHAWEPGVQLESP